MEKLLSFSNGGEALENLLSFSNGIHWSVDKAHHKGRSTAQFLSRSVRTAGPLAVVHVGPFQQKMLRCFTVKTFKLSLRFVRVAPKRRELALLSLLRSAAKPNRILKSSFLAISGCAVVGSVLSAEKSSSNGLSQKNVVEDLPIVSEDCGIRRHVSKMGVLDFVSVFFRGLTLWLVFLPPMILSPLALFSKSWNKWWWKLVTLCECLST